MVAAVITVSAVGAYLLRLVATPTVATMKAPGADGVLISRVVFLAKKKLYFKLLHSVGGAAFRANPKLYFALLRTAGAAAAAAAFAA
uniref:Uncharacterized protein n=1 Tax=Setaria viridis TaxID=4556 RepID=A0A4U6W4Y1_SETVI|nr:hypothetical protein SEVIR_2G393900v2 [Setaria viridis]